MTCDCTVLLIELQPRMQALHALMSEVVPDVRLVTLRCGHTVVGAYKWTDAHDEAIEKALALLGVDVERTDRDGPATIRGADIATIR